MPSVLRSIKRVVALVVLLVGCAVAWPTWASGTCVAQPDGTLKCSVDPPANGGDSSGGGASGGSGTGLLSGITNWFSGAIKSVFSAVVTFFKDLLVGAVSMILDLFAMAVEAIPVPDLLSSFSLSGMLGNVSSQLGYFLNILKIPAGLTALGAGYAFRLLRKFVTLFQW